MNVRLQLVLLLAPGMALAALVTPADAATQGDTTTVFTTTAGSLSITVPASASIGSGPAGSSLSAQLGAVQVVDNRALLTGSWTTTVSSTAFVTGGSTAAETVSNGSVSYWSGPATASSGVGSRTPGQLTAANAQDLSASRTAFSKVTGAGNNSTTWNPTLIIAVPSAAVAGTYTGTITHSVS